jgi:hypothetical protein
MKALLLRQGLHFDFRKVERGRYTIVTLKDGKVLSFSKSELRSINHKNQLSFARFSERKKQELLLRIKSQIELSFAILVRNLQIRGYAGKELTESAAIKMLTKDGTDTTHFHSLLGLNRKSSKKLTLQNLELIRHKRNVLLFNDRHIAVCSYGYYEDFGKAVRLGKEAPSFLGKKVTGWFEIK